MPVLASTDFSFELTPVKNSVDKGEQAVYNLTVYNKKAVEDTFRIILPSDPRWNIQTDPLSDRLNGLVVPPLQAKTTTLLLKPSNELSGRNGVTIGIESKKNPGIKEDKTIIITIGRDYPPSYYVPSIRTTVEIASQVDPRADNSIKLTLQNLNVLELTDIKITLKGDLIDLEESTTLGPKGTDTAVKELTIPFKLDPYQEPVKDVLSVDTYVTVNGKTFKFESEPSMFEVTPYSEITTDKKLEEKLLIRKYTYTFTNDGNSEKKRMMRAETTWYRRLFTSTSPQAQTFWDDNFWWLAWQVDLKPRESVSVVVTENFWPLPIAVILIVIAIAAYFYFRSPVIIRKSYTKIELKEGGLSEIKVILHIKNRTKSTIHNLSIMDYVPKIADLVKEFSAGVPHPNKILGHEHKGSIIKWDIEKFDRSEERIFTYKMHCKLSVLGKMTLKPTLARFTYEGRARSARSNPVSVKA